MATPGIVQTTIGTGNGAATTPANLYQTPGGNLQPAPMQGGQGAFTAVPTGSANGTPIFSGPMPEGGIGVQMYLKSGDSITYSIQTAQPTSPPPVYTLTGGQGGNSSEAFEPLCSGAQIYVTATTGTPLFRVI